MAADKKSYTYPNCATPGCMNLFIAFTRKQRYCRPGCRESWSKRQSSCVSCGQLRDHVPSGLVLCLDCRKERNERNHKRKRFICSACKQAPADRIRGPALCSKCRNSCRMCGKAREIRFRLCQACKPEYDRLERKRNSDAAISRRISKSICRNCKQSGAYKGYCTTCYPLCRECFLNPKGNYTYCLDCRRAKVKSAYRSRKEIPFELEGRLSCLECGKEVTPAGRHVTIAFHVKFCAQACRDRYKSRQRRAKRNKVAHEPYSRVYVFDRDNWACGICKKKINDRHVYPHPKSGSIDHIVPISLGGTDTLDNVQAAHWRCNASKGNRPSNDQLRLVG
jgi:hypothetical protein